MTTDPSPPPAEPAWQPPTRMGFSWGDFFAFRVMITPSLIRVVYLIGVVLITIGAVLAFLSVPVSFTVNGNTTSSGAGGIIGAFLAGVLFFVFGQLFWRVFMEWLIVFFRIHESVSEIEKRGR